jgi:CheY-like chemotaxis protein
MISNIRRILLVEDDPQDAELTLSALAVNALANKVDLARDGEEALDYLNCAGEFSGRVTGNPALVLLDLNLPKVGGLEVLREIKTREDLRTIPVVVLTSSKLDQDVIQGYRLGVNAYMVKPVKFDTFINAVQTLGMFWAVLNEPPCD